MIHMLAVLLVALCTFGALAQDRQAPAPSVAYVFGSSGSFVSIDLAEQTVIARWRLSEIAGLDDVLPEAPTGGLGQWLVYDPIYDAKRHRLLLIAASEVTAFEELRFQLIALYPPRLSLITQVQLGTPSGNPPKPPRLLHDVEGHGFALLRPSTALAGGVTAHLLDSDSLEIDRRILLKRATRDGFPRLAAFMDGKILLEDELFSLTNTYRTPDGLTYVKGRPVHAIMGLDEDARHALGQTTSTGVEPWPELLRTFMHSAASARVLLTLPRFQAEAGAPTGLGSSTLLSYNLKNRAVGPPIELEHWVVNLVLAADGRLAATLDTAAGVLSSLDLETGKIHHQVADPRFQEPLARVLCTDTEGSAVVASSDQLMASSPGQDAVTVLRGVHPNEWTACVFAIQ